MKEIKPLDSHDFFLKKSVATNYKMGSYVSSYMYSTSQEKSVTEADKKDTKVEESEKTGDVSIASIPLSSIIEETPLKDELSVPKTSESEFVAKTNSKKNKKNKNKNKQLSVITGEEKISDKSE